MIRRPPSSTPFPTRRSSDLSFAQDLQSLVDIEDSPLPKTSAKTMEHFAYPSFGTADTSRGCPFACSFCTRSEEHTSELQSRLHLVCRLLLEKKKNEPEND